MPDISQNHCSCWRFLCCPGDLIPVFFSLSCLSQEEVKQKEVQQTIATVPDVSPSTLYCVKVQAFSEPYNKSSAYSQQQCIHTPAGGHSLAILPLCSCNWDPFPGKSKLKAPGNPGWAQSFTPQSLAGSKESLNSTFSGVFYPWNWLSPSESESPVLKSEEINQICVGLRAPLDASGEGRDCTHSEQKNKSW